MNSFVASVDETPTTPEVQDVVVTALVGAGFTDPEHLVGTTDSVIGELAGWLAGPAGGLLKRTFRCAEDMSEAKRVKAATLTSSSQSGHPVSQVPSNLAAGSLLSLLGPEASAGAVASALTAGSIVVGLNDMLEKAAVKDLPYHLRPQLALFQLLAAAHKSAWVAVPVRKAYTYVDLTHKDVLPLWMGSEAVGGHTPRPGEFDWDPNADTASLGALGRAFKGALEKPRHFRNMVQWSAVWHRFATAAAAMGQLTWPVVLSHANQMDKLAEEERISGTGPALVFIYDELLRKLIATWGEWGDPSLDPMTAFGEIEKQVLEAARTRLLQTGFSRHQNQRNHYNQDMNNKAESELRLKSSLSKPHKRVGKATSTIGNVNGCNDEGQGQRRRQRQWQGTYQQADEVEKFFDKQRQSIEKKNGRKATALTGRDRR